MGWLIYSRFDSPCTHAQERAEIEKLCTFESENRVGKPVQLSKVNSVWYAAVKVLPKVGKQLDHTEFLPDSDGGYTFAAIFLTTRSAGEWGYKDMDETMGPNESKAPRTLLRKLSPLVDRDSYAAKWRAACEHWADTAPPTLKEGDTIRTRPIALTNGTTVQNFRVGIQRRRGQNRKVYQCLDNNGLYSLQRRHLQGAEILA